MRLYNRAWLAALLVGALAIATSAEWAITPHSGPLDVQVLENSPGRIMLHFSINDYQLGSVEIDGQKYTTVKLPGEPVLLEAGAPALPRLCRSVIIPDNAQMTAKIVYSHYEEIAAEIAPSKGNLTRDVDPATVPYEFGQSYQTDALYPGELVELDEPHILRDYRGVTVCVYPFQHNPVQGVLRVYTDVVVELVPVGPAQVNVFDRATQAKRPSATFEQIYARHFINYEADRYTVLDEEGDLLIICYDSWIPNVQPLVDHKNTVGISTTIVGVSTIGNNSTSIKNYIQNVYNTSDLAFVLLVGDAAQVATPTASGGASDPSYSKLAGSDNYPDIVVGRFSAQSTADVDTQVLRTIEYEQLPATQQAWFKRGTGIASNQGTGDDGEYDNEHIDNIRTDLLAYGYTQVDQIYDPSGTATQVTNALNAGRGIINYCGHGSTTSWSSTGFSNTNVNNLVNDNMLPFIVSVACVNGAFTSTTCFAEAWLRATNGSEPTGAIGAYMSSVNQSWSPPMEAQDEFNILLVNEAYFSYGAYCYAGSCSMMDAYGADGVEMFDTWHIFGDPSVRIYGEAAPPHGMRVAPSSGFATEGPTGGPFTPSSIQYTVENANESGSISYQVTKAQPWVTITNGSGTLPALDSAVVTVSINSSANSLGNGEYYDTIQFTNLTDHDGDTTRDVILTVGVPTVQYQWNMDSNPAWSTQGLWAWGRPAGLGGQYGNPDPTSGYTGDNVYGYNLNGDYENSLLEQHLASNAIGCSELTNVSVRFWRYLGVEQPYYDHAYFRVSTNGSTWQNIWQNGAQVTDASWQYQEFDLAEIADNQPTLYLRWTMGSTDGSWQFCGWNIDDVEIWGLAPGGPVYDLGDLNCDGAVNSFDIDPFVMVITGAEPYADYYAAYPDCNHMLGDMNDDGDVNSFDIDAFVAAIAK